MSRIVLLLIFLFMTSPITSNGKINEENNTKVIQKLIDSAEVGKVVHIPPGKYYGNINIDKTISLIANGNVTIVGDRKGDVITLEADGITIKGFKVQNSGRMLTKEDAAIKVRSNKNKIIQNQIDHSLHGIYLEKSNDNVLDGNRITGIRGLRSADRGNGIQIFNSKGNQLKNNIITQTRDGMYFSFSDTNFIQKNKIYNVRYGLHYMYSNNNSFYNNRFYNNIGGAAIMYSNRIKLENNYFYNNRGLLSFGLLLQTANDNIIKNNHIYMNQKGLFADQSNRNFIAHNEFVHNNIGIEIWTSSIQNYFTQNQFNANVIQYISNGKNDRNKWSYHKIGNAWSENILFDLDKNGVGDKPYKYSSSYGEVISQNQLGFLFLDSPSIKIYENVKQTLSEDQMQIKDPYPVVLRSDKGMKTVLNFMVYFLFLIFLLVRRKIYNAIFVKRLEGNVSQ